MESNHNIIEIINDLIRVNHERREGYIKAAGATGEHDNDMRAIFERMADDSRQYAQELSDLLEHAAASPSSRETEPGSIYNAWMDVQATFAGRQRASILASCEFMEEGVQRAYETALAAPLQLEQRRFIATQKSLLFHALELIKKFRAMREVVM